jgi:hypothetical protein
MISYLILGTMSFESVFELSVNSDSINQMDNAHKVLRVDILLAGYTKALLKVERFRTKLLGVWGGARIPINKSDALHRIIRAERLYSSDLCCWKKPEARGPDATK